MNRAAARAAATAACTSGLPASWTMPISELSIGVRLSKLLPLEFLTYSPFSLRFGWSGADR